MSSSSNNPRRAGKSTGPSSSPMPAAASAQPSVSAIPVPSASAPAPTPVSAPVPSAAPSAPEHAPGLLRFGWWSLLAYLLLGLVLETLHGFKIGWYLDVGYEMRRLMFTLAHAHGTLLSLVTIAAALTSRSLKNFTLAPSATRALTGATILLPMGFLLGGIIIHDGDPGLGILLVPLGAAFLIYAVARLARDLSRSQQ